MIENTIINTAIAANLAAMSDRLSAMAALAKEAETAMADGQKNQAIGTIIDFERMLPEAQALYSAVIAMHRGTA